MMLEFPSGADTIRAALYSPPDAQLPAPGVILLPDVGGLSEHFHDIGRRLAREGFTAFVLDPYTRGEAPDTSSPEAVMAFIAQLPDRQVIQDIDAAVRFLSTRPEVEDQDIGITGFCMGGKFTILAACEVEDLFAAVPWYGMLRSSAIDARNPEHPLDAIPRLKCPMLALFGADDPLIPQDQIRELERRVHEHDLEADTIVYPGAGHAFFNDTRPEAFRAEAAESAWIRAVEFLHRHLD